MAKFVPAFSGWGEAPQKKRRPVRKTRKERVRCGGGVGEHSEVIQTTALYLSRPSVVTMKMSWHGRAMRPARTLRLAMFWGVCWVWVFVVASRGGEGGDGLTNGGGASKSGALIATQLESVAISPAEAGKFHYETFSVRDDAAQPPVETVWKTPENVIGVIVGLHGCKHSATDWGPRSTDCPKCVPGGLPEERDIVSHGVNSGHLVVALSSLDRENKCWGDASGTKDSHRIITAVSALRKRFKLEALPTFIVGFASGGDEAVRLATDAVAGGQLNIRAVNVISQRPDVSKVPKPVIYTVFKNNEQVTGVTEDIAALRARGIDADSVECNAVPLTASSLSDRIKDLTVGESAAAFTHLRNANFVGSDGFVTLNPATSDWKTLLSDTLSGSSRDSDGEGRLLLGSEDVSSPVAEVLNRHYGYHEMCASPIEEVFRFFAAHKG